MNKVEIVIDSPITVDDIRYDKLEMRAPKVKDNLASEKAKGTVAEIEVRTIANLCEVAPSVIEELEMKDYLKLQEEYTNFLGLEPATRGRLA